MRHLDVSTSNTIQHSEHGGHLGEVPRIWETLTERTRAPPKFGSSSLKDTEST